MNDDALSARERLEANRAKRAGAVKGAGSKQAQHVDFYKKALLRKRLLQMAVPGAVYCPFIGDGDIAAEVYADRQVWGADLDADRVKVAAGRVSEGSLVVVGDCNGWPFRGSVNLPVFSVADLDAYSNPYPAAHAFFDHAQLADRLVVFFTDGQRQSIVRMGHYLHPSGEHVRFADLPERRKALNFYGTKIVRPWLDAFAAERGWRVVKWQGYLRMWMLYHGAVLDRR